MAGEFDGFPLFDWERSACLCDVGAPGHSIAVAVTDDGRDTLWMVDDAELNAEHPRCGNGDQPHERVGIRRQDDAQAALPREHRLDQSLGEAALGQVVGAGDEAVLGGRGQDAA